jgi:cell division FtsZ-interacting protein ZapD
VTRRRLGSNSGSGSFWIPSRVKWQAHQKPRQDADELLWLTRLGPEERGRDPVGLF